MVTKEQIDRINFLAKKAKESGLSDAERGEQQQLRRAYIDAMKASLTAQLDNTYIVGENNEKRKLKRKEK
ncbi:MAG: DUF896 domain-containing protein [Clostridiales bacterium]|nr:DUF896 domain-containing protein [Clostridiales bacterium]